MPAQEHASTISIVYDKSDSLSTIVSVVTAPRVYHVASRPLQRTACELLHGPSLMAAANSEQCHSFSLLRTSLSHAASLLHLLHVAGCQPHKVQIMRPDV